MVGLDPWIQNHFNIPNCLWQWRPSKNQPPSKLWQNSARRTKNHLSHVRGRSGGSEWRRRCRSDSSNFQLSLLSSLIWFSSHFPAPNSCSSIPPSPFSLPALLSPASTVRERENGKYDWILPQPKIMCKAAGEHDTTKNRGKVKRQTEWTGHGEVYLELLFFFDGPTTETKAVDMLQTCQRSQSSKQMPWPETFGLRVNATSEPEEETKSAPMTLISVMFHSLYSPENQNKASGMWDIFGMILQKKEIGMEICIIATFHWCCVEREKQYCF